MLRRRLGNTRVGRLQRQQFCHHVFSIELGPRNTCDVQSAAEIVRPWNAVPRYLHEKILLDLHSKIGGLTYPLIVVRLLIILHGIVGSAGTFASYTMKVNTPKEPRTRGVMTRAEDHGYRTPPQVSARSNAVLLPIIMILPLRMDEG